MAENRGALCASLLVGFWSALQYELHAIVVRAGKAGSHPLLCRDVPACRPRRPKCCVSNHHIVFTNASGVVLPNLPSFHSTFSSSFVKFLALLGRLSRPACHSNFAFPYKTCFDEWNSRSFTIDDGYCLSFKCLSRAAIIRLIWLIILAVFVLHFELEFLQLSVQFSLFVFLDFQSYDLSFAPRLPHT